MSFTAHSIFHTAYICYQTTYSLFTTACKNSIVYKKPLSKIAGERSDKNEITKTSRVSRNDGLKPSFLSFLWNLQQQFWNI